MAMGPASSGSPYMVMPRSQNKVTLQGDTMHGNEAMSPICPIFATKYMLVYNSGLLHFLLPQKARRFLMLITRHGVPLEGDMVPFVVITLWGT